MQVRKNVHAALAQLDRVSGYEPEGQGFESLTPRHKKRTPTGVRFLFLMWKGLEGFGSE